MWFFLFAHFGFIVFVHHTKGDLTPSTFKPSWWVLTKSFRLPVTLGNSTKGIVETTQVRKYPRRNSISCRFFNIQDSPMKSVYVIFINTLAHVFSVHQQTTYINGRGSTSPCVSVFFISWIMPCKFFPKTETDLGGQKVGICKNYEVYLQQLTHTMHTSLDALLYLIMQMFEGLKC